MWHLENNTLNWSNYKKRCCFQDFYLEVNEVNEIEWPDVSRFGPFLGQKAE